jgi:hypothetical protein
MDGVTILFEDGVHCADIAIAILSMAMTCEPQIREDSAPNFWMTPTFLSEPTP